MAPEPSRDSSNDGRLSAYLKGFKLDHAFIAVVSAVVGTLVFTLTWQAARIYRGGLIIHHPGLLYPWSSRIEYLLGAVVATRTAGSTQPAEGYV